MDTVYNITLCADCVWQAANGASEVHPEAEPLTKLRGYLVGIEDDCEGHFGDRCDGCETRWAGNRFCCYAVQA